MSFSTARTRTTPPWFALPTLGWLIWFLLIPFVLVGVYSFFSKGPYGEIQYQLTTSNYSRSADWIYLKILWSSVKLALFTTVSCLLLGYPMAYVMARSTPKTRSVLLMLVVIPFWTNFVVRAYAVKVLLGMQGPLSHLLLALGFIHEPISFSNSYFAVWFGMVTNYLPFMVLPLFVSLEKLDFSLLDAAQDLGAGPFQQLWRVLLPLTRAGIFTGSILVFAPALGEFVIPDIFGGAKTMLIGNLITEQFLKARDWPFGSALSILLLLTVLVLVYFYSRSLKNEVRHS